MSPSGRAESIAHLRRAVETIEARSGTAEPRAGGNCRWGARSTGAWPAASRSTPCTRSRRPPPPTGRRRRALRSALAARCLAERRSAGLDHRGGFCRARHGRPLRTRPRCSRAQPAAPRVRARARCAGPVPGDGGRVAQRRSSLRARRSLAPEELRSPCFAPPAARRARRRNSSLSRAGERLWRGRENLQRGGNALRDRGGAERA